MSEKNRCPVCGNFVSFPGNKCYICQKKERLARIQDEIRTGVKDETYAEEEVICPWCGEVNEFAEPCDEQYVDGEYEMECCECGNKFTLTTNVSYDYSTERVEGE